MLNSPLAIIRNPSVICQSLSWRAWAGRRSNGTTRRNVSASWLQCSSVRRMMRCLVGMIDIFSACRMRGPRLVLFANDLIRAIPFAYRNVQVVVAMEVVGHAVRFIPVFSVDNLDRLTHDIVGFWRQACAVTVAVKSFIGSFLHQAIMIELGIPIFPGLFARLVEGLNRATHQVKVKATVMRLGQAEFPVGQRPLQLGAGVLDNVFLAAGGVHGFCFLPGLAARLGRWWSKLLGKFRGFHRDICDFDFLAFGAPLAVVSLQDDCTIVAHAAEFVGADYGITGFNHAHQFTVGHAFHGSVPFLFASRSFVSVYTA